MSLRSIEINFQETVRLAASIAELANTSRQLVNEDLFTAIGDMDKAWSSESRTMLSGKEVKAAERLQRETEKLKKLAEDMETQAKRIYRAELNNDLCARNRIY